MAGIYTRDNIPYSTMLQNAIANRAKAAEREAAYTQSQGKLWGDAVANVGGVIGRAVGGYNNWKGDATTAEEEEAELERLKKELEDYQAQQVAADAQSAQIEHATNLMEGSHPNVVGDYNRNPFDEDFDNPYKLPGDRNANQSDYFNYQMYMNRLFGGH